MENNSYKPVPKEPTSKISPLPLLDEMIRNQEIALRNYIEKGNPNETYVRIQNENISKLYQVFNFIEGLNHLDYFLLIEDAISSLSARDPEISVLNIVMKVRKGPDNIAIITLNPFCDETV